MAATTWLAGMAVSLAGQDLPREASAPNSPSEATATVSPTSATQALQPLDDAGSSFDLSLGTSFASGHFGLPSRTRIWSTALGLRFATGGLRLTASVPWMRIRSASRIFTGIDSTPVVVGGTPPGPRRTTDGFGDLTLGAAYALPDMPENVELELSGRVKLPTASADRLSSGRTDYSAGVQVTRVIGRAAPFASVSYRVLGDPRGLRLKDGFAVSAGSSVVVGPVVALGSYHYARRASRFVGDLHELFAGASTLVAPRVRGTAFVTKGLSRGSAAVSAGVGLSLTI